MITMSPLKIIVCVVAALALASVSTASTDPTELKALIDFYNATNGPSWTKTWDITTDPCSDGWFGVVCQEPHVNTLTLQMNNLSGTIPSSISNLGFLQFLYLSKNAIAGTIPESMGDMKPLLQIGLDENAMVGEIPNSFAGLTNLQHLFLQNNRFNGSLAPVSNLTNLVYAYFSNNKFSGEIPEAMGNLYLLQQIGLDSNDLTGSIPSGFGSKQNFLQSFYCQDNDLTGDFPTALCKVSSCYANDNEFSCPLPPQPCCSVTTCKS